MSLASVAALRRARALTAQAIPVSKASTTTTAGAVASLWTSTGTPTAGSAPGTTARIPTNATTGALGLVSPASGRVYLSEMHLTNDVSISQSFILYDRLADVSGYVGNTTSLQSYAIDASDSGLNSRRGSSDYSEVSWWIEWYSGTGTSSGNITFTYTNVAGTSGLTLTQAFVASPVAKRMQRIVNPASDFIKSIQSAQMSASTSSAGNFGITAMRHIAAFNTKNLNKMQSLYESSTMLAPIESDACLFFTSIGPNAFNGLLEGIITVNGE